MCSEEPVVNTVRPATVESAAAERLRGYRRGIWGAILDNIISKMPNLQTAFGAQFPID